MGVSKWLHPITIFCRKKPILNQLLRGEDLTLPPLLPLLPDDLDAPPLNPPLLLLEGGLLKLREPESSCLGVKRSAERDD